MQCVSQYRCKILNQPYLNNFSKRKFPAVKSNNYIKGRIGENK